MTIWGCAGNFEQIFKQLDSAKNAGCLWLEEEGNHMCGHYYQDIADIGWISTVSAVEAVFVDYRK